MARKNWKVSLDGNEYSITLKHGFFLGKRHITVNGETVVETKFNIVDVGSEHPIKLGNRNAIVSIRIEGLISARYDLYVDGVSVQDGKAYRPQRPSRTFAPGGPKPVRFSKWTLAGLVLGSILLNLGLQLPGDHRTLLLILGGAIMGCSFGSFGFQLVRGTRKLVDDPEFPVGVIPDGWLHEFQTTFSVTTTLSEWAGRHKYNEVTIPEWPKSRFFAQGGMWLQRRVVQVEVDGINVKINAWIDMGGGASIPLDKGNKISLPGRKLKIELRDLLDRLGQMTTS